MHERMTEVKVVIHGEKDDLSQVSSSDYGLSP